MLLFPFSGLDWFYSFPTHVCVSLDFFKGLINFPYKDLDLLQKIGLKVIFLSFCWVGISRTAVGELGSGDAMLL